MSLFGSESEMQQWLSGALSANDGIGDLLTSDSRELSQLNATTDAEIAVVASYSRCLESLWFNEVISEDRNISISSGDSLRPDFLLFAPETDGFVFVELKNISGPTREAGTELGAYSGEMRTALPFISDAELTHVIISPVWPTLLCHYVFHEIFWHGRNVACLQPVENTPGQIALSHRVQAVCYT